MKYVCFSHFRYEEAAQFFCVACEYNERITTNLTHKMKGMDHEFLLENRRRCLRLWNQASLKKVTLKTNNLNVDNILILFNKYCSGLE
jgi:hypothetical protein